MALRLELVEKVQGKLETGPEMIKLGKDQAGVAAELAKAPQMAEHSLARESSPLQLRERLAPQPLIESPLLSRQLQAQDFTGFRRQVGEHLLFSAAQPKRLKGAQQILSSFLVVLFKLGIKNAAFLAGGFDSESRNRRPPRDPLNALFSYVYSLLVKELTVVSNAMGFDAYLGFYHQPRYGKPAMALELMEEFRVIVADSSVLSVINNQIVGLSDFKRVGDGVLMSQGARKSVTEAFERRMGEKL